MSRPKERLTYPRTGYATPPHKPVPWTGFFAPPLPTEVELAYGRKQKETARWYLAFYVVLWAFGNWPNRWFCVLGGIVLGLAWRRQQPSARPSWVMPAVAS